MTAQVLLGTQSWNFNGWIGPFYQQGTRPLSMLSVYSRAFATVEVDSTFYGLPPEPVVQAWAQQVPDGFIFSLKVPQAITHERRLVGVGDLLARFLERVRPLEDHLGPLLVQLSPAFRPTEQNRIVFKEFLEALPGGFRWAVEFRHSGWIIPATLGLLQSRNAALVLADGRWIHRSTMLDLASDPTADFAYLRWLGSSRALNDFSRIQIDRGGGLWQWATAVQELSQRVTAVFGYISNQFEGHAPASVRKLQEMIGQEPVAAEALRDEAKFF